MLTQFYMSCVSHVFIISGETSHGYINFEGLVFKMAESMAETRVCFRASHVLVNIHDIAML